MKWIKRILLIFALLFLISMITITPLAGIGLIIFITGIYQMKNKRKGKNRFMRPGWLVAAGIIFSLVMGMVFVKPDQQNTANETKLKQEQKINSEQIKAEKEEAKKKAEEAKKKAEEAALAKQQAEEQAKKEAEAKQQAEEKAKQDAAQKEQQTAASLGLVAATISRVVDGDTVQLSTGEKVRFVGVNTPESTTRHETYGKEASNYTTSKLQGKSVWLQKDVSETDRYGRLLRIIWLAIPTNDMDENEIRSKMFNADLVLNGYAEPSTYPPDVKYSDSFVKFAREARTANKGLWAYGANGTTKGDLDPKNSTSASASSSTSSSSSTQSSSSAPAASAAPAPASGGTEIFANCTELRKKYPQGVPASHPAYQAKMDRDHDNYACETN